MPQVGAANVHAMGAVVEIEGLSKNFGRVRALDQVSLSVAEGEVFGFLGPNGAGKTTTIRILLGLQHPDIGTARIGGHDCWTDHSRAARLFGATLEQPALYGFLSGRDNLRLFARTLGPVDEKQITELLSTVGMTERANDKVKRYSMGMRQRLALAQAMLGRPRLLILDEPTNGLDPNGIHGLRILLRKLATEQHLTIFFSSHLLSEVEELCDRVVVLHRGEVKAAGPLSELMNVKGYQYRIDVSDVDKAMDIVQSIEGVTVARGTIKNSISVSSDKDVARIINHALVAGGIGVDQLVHTQRGLEDVYMELTGVAPGSPLSAASTASHQPPSPLSSRS
jgi:ABC-2 type transport system ATP-binding protein